MEMRLLVAYGLIALLAVFVAALVLWLRHNSRERTVARGRLRDSAFEQHLAERERGEG